MHIPRVAYINAAVYIRYVHCKLEAPTQWIDRP